MKKILYVNGCSHTAGYEITEPNRWHKELDNVKSFGGLLATKYNLSLINDAIPGQGNESIYSQTVHRILNLLDHHKPEEIFALIGWAGSERRNFISSNGWYKLCTGLTSIHDDVNRAYKNWVLLTDWGSSFCNFAIMYIGLVKFFEQYKIDYCMFNSSIALSFTSDNEINLVPRADQVQVDHRSTFEIFEHIKNNQNYYDPFDKGEFWFKCTQAGFKFRQDGGHFGEDAHAWYADELEKFINTLPNSIL